MFTLGTCAFILFSISDDDFIQRESVKKDQDYSLINAIVGKQIDSTVLASIPDHVRIENQAKLWDSYYVDSLNLSYVIQHKDQKIVWVTPGKKGAAEKANELQAERDKLIERQFSVWDGSHRNLEKTIKNGLNDPNSYEHVETRYRVQNDSVIIYTTFRGSNAFGGILTKQVMGISDMEGNILKAEYLE